MGEYGCREPGVLIYCPVSCGTCTPTPIVSPTVRPTATPTDEAPPTVTPTELPTTFPTAGPTELPTTFPTFRPTMQPTPEFTSDFVKGRGCCTAEGKDIRAFMTSEERKNPLNKTKFKCRRKCKRDPTCTAFLSIQKEKDGHKTYKCYLIKDSHPAVAGRD